MRFALSVQSLVSLVALELATDDPRHVTLELTPELSVRYHSADAESILEIGPDHPLYKLVIWDYNPLLLRLRVHFVHKKVGG
jgi:hypothetical protein